MSFLLCFDVLGHCSDVVTNLPPRGLQFTLGTKSNPAQFDTIVMANLVSITQQQK